MKPGQSRVLSRLCVRVEGKKAPLALKVLREITRRAPAWLQHFNSNDIIDDDTVFLHDMVSCCGVFQCSTSKARELCAAPLFCVQHFVFQIL